MGLTKRNVKNLRTTQRAMERVMLGTTLKDHIRKDDMLLMVDSHQVTGVMQPNDISFVKLLRCCG
ncbi:hypothetical protein HUJ05_000701 [Dendroctonus ponderosae]|nr:hypothetical protein HUJ05_000701 [Dendroctonus ponderosae]